MSVKLVSITTPFIENNIKSAEDLIAYCARVSNPSNQLNPETAPKLLGYLIKHKHWSPFEMVDMCVEIKTSRAIAAQILRHRSFSFQEFSQRYAQSTNFQPIELRKQGKTNRQVGDEPFDPTWQGWDHSNNTKASEKITEHIKKSNELYNQLIDLNVAKECARMVLPLCTETTMYMKGSIRSWLGYLNVRLETNTQKEHREIAYNIAKILTIEFPNVAAACNYYNDYKGGFM